jgi:hypothetical protein
MVRAKLRTLMTCEHLEESSLLDALLVVFDELLVAARASDAHVTVHARMELWIAWLLGRIVKVRHGSP